MNTAKSGDGSSLAVWGSGGRELCPRRGAQKPDRCRGLSEPGRLTWSGAGLAAKLASIIGAMRWQATRRCSQVVLTCCCCWLKRQVTVAKGSRGRLGSRLAQFRPVSRRGRNAPVQLEGSFTTITAGHSLKSFAFQSLEFCHGSGDSNRREWTLECGSHGDSIS